MFGIPSARLLYPCVVAAVVACNRPTATAQSTGSAPAAAVGGNACSQKLLTVADVGGILSAPITGTKDIPGDGNTCKFITASFPSISVTLRPGSGKASLGIWKSGKMPISSTPLAGVGDEAVWVSSLNEVVSEKNDLLCDIMAEGVARDLAGSVAVEQQRIGALCNKIFAAAR